MDPFRVSDQQYVARRRKVLDYIGKQGISIFHSAIPCIRNGHIEYPFRQESNFYYLTGITDPDVICLLTPHADQGEYILFVPEKDMHKEQWEGTCINIESAQSLYKADKAFLKKDWADLLPSLLEGKSSVYYNGLHPFNKHLFDCINQHYKKKTFALEHPLQFIDINAFLAELRLYKSSAEIFCMQKAAEISAQAHIQAMQACKPGLYEYQIEATLMHAFMQAGSRFPAYPPIVASGKNATILHYTKNAEKLSENDLLLIDAGCEYQNYASDITRTFPINGKFSYVQQALYELVLASQLAAIEQAIPGTPIATLQKTIIQILTQGLIDLGLLKGSISSLIEKKAYQTFYMHNAGHWIGLDTHDIGTYTTAKGSRLLQPHMVFTIEPGIYITPHAHIDPKWWNIGIRIEDMILTTEKGNAILSSTVPKDIKTIEKIIQNKQYLS